MLREARIVTDLGTLPENEFSQLDHAGNPFLALPLLRALEDSGSADAASGWLAHHLALFENDKLVAFAPTYQKAHSHGEFVFDWSWADAYQRHGRRYYPKLLTAIPYSPIPGPRLLVQQGHPQEDELRNELIALAMSQCQQLKLSSWHCNFIDDKAFEALAAAPPLSPEAEPAVSTGELPKVQKSEPKPLELLRRNDWQFHWHNQDFSSFTEFLGTLRSKKRKNMLRDRRLVRDAGIQFRRLQGSDIKPADLDFIFSCYQLTFLQHGNHPALTRQFFELILQDMPDALLAVIAMRGDERIAMALYLQGGGRLYGRYWGTMEEIPGLHFETAYHQGIEHCIETGLFAFEPGAQGEHKISRGFSPVKTQSTHLIRDPVFHDAIKRYLAQEADWMADYADKLDQRLPFRKEIDI